MEYQPDQFEGENFLGSEDIDEYIRLLRSHFPPNHAVFPAGCWLLLTDSNKKKITKSDDRLKEYLSRAWFKNIGEANIVYVPVLYNSHWILATIDYASKTITIYNSLPLYYYDKISIHNNLQRLAGFLKNEGDEDNIDWDFVVDDKGCLQSDDYNCGIHVLQRIRDNVLGDLPLSIPADDLRAYLKNELKAQEISLFTIIAVSNAAVPDGEEEQNISFEALTTYYMNEFETVEQLAIPSRKKLGILRVNQPIKDSPTYIIKFSVDGKVNRIKEAYEKSTAAEIFVYGLILNPAGYDQKFMGLLEEDRTDEQE